MINLHELIQNENHRSRLIKILRQPIHEKASVEKVTQDLIFLDSIGEISLDDFMLAVNHDFQLQAKHGFEQDLELIDFIDDALWTLENKEYTDTFRATEFEGIPESIDCATHVASFYAKPNYEKYFLSVDLRSANWQSLINAKILKVDYPEFVTQLTDYKLPLTSKYFRTKITGKFAPNEIMASNKALLVRNLNDIRRELIGLEIIDEHSKIAAIYADEIIWEISKDAHDRYADKSKSEIEAYMKSKLDLEFHVTAYQMLPIGIGKSVAKVFQNEPNEYMMVSPEMKIVILKLLHNRENEINDTDFERIKLGKLSREEYVSTLKSFLKSNC